MKEIQKRFSERRKKGATKSQPSSVNEAKSNNVENSLLGQIQKEPSPKSQPDVLIQRLPKAVQLPQTKLCPTCGIKMEIQIATSGESKGKQFFVCR
jgi:hypothetical protein